jgi:hypothetical protein
VRAAHTSVAFTLDRYGHMFPGRDTERPRPGFWTEAVQPAARVNVTCVTPLGEEMASTS